MNLVSTLGPRLANDFQRKLLEASLQSAKASGNPLRLNNFSTSFRELFRHVLSDLAPDAQIRNSKWFVPDATARTGITRGHKISYVLHGGLDPSYVLDELDIDVASERTALLSSIDRLSKFTHVNEATFDLPDADVESHVQNACQALEGFLNCADESRRLLCAKVEERVQDDVLNEAIGETIQEIDELATHHVIESVSVDELEVVSINSKTIEFIAYGNIEVELQWGSSSEFRRGEGAAINDSYPLTCRFVSHVHDPEALELVEGSLNVDTSSWWDGYTD